MELVADFHIHSHHAYATSKHLTLENIYLWAKLKGVNLIATGDITHPEWFSQIESKLQETKPGLYSLNSSIKKKIDQDIPKALQPNPCHFILATEVSCIYKRHAKTRKVHLLLLFPNIKTVKQLSQKLSKITNLHQDGRPTLGLDSYHLLQMCLEIDQHIMLIPAHAWTPWFGIFGSKSGFDTLEEAFADLTPHIYAIETGLSSDPQMNWQLSQHDHLTLISNSDAHSLQKLGREATLLSCQLTYQDIAQAIKTNDDRLIGTIEFYPQEGKYHHDGHRDCNVRCNPSQSQKNNNICPTCTKPLTLGVLNRIQSLADRNPTHTHQPKKVDYIIPLAELIAHTLNIKNPQAKRVQTIYQQFINHANEFTLLRKTPASTLAAIHEPTSIAIHNMRQGNVSIQPGYDGVFGAISVDHTPQNPQLNLLPD